jgi:ribosomal protein S18 acetylase RimI-like enzyme
MIAATPSFVGTMDVTTRFLTEDDIPDLLDVWHDAGLHIRPAGREHPERLQEEIRDFPNNFIGAYAGLKLVAAVIASWDGRRAWINRLAVRQSFRRHGLGRRLIAEAEKELRRRGAQVLAVLIEPDNTPSLALFQTEGYLDSPAALYLTKRDSLDV